MPRTQSTDLTTIFQAYKRRDRLDLYLSDNSALHLSRGAVNRSSIDYQNYIASVEDLTASIDSGIDRITINCQNVNSLMGFNVASNLRLLDYAVAEYGKIYQSLRNPALSVDLDQFPGVLANAEVDESRISFELIVAYESLGSVIAARALSPRCWWTYKNGIECTSTSSLPTCPKNRAACKERGAEKDFGGFEYFEEAASELPGAGGNPGDGPGGGDPCFTGETKVWTPDGEFPISEFRERLREGKNQIFSFNPATGEIETDEVLEVFEHQVTSFFTFGFEHSNVNVTKEHPFFVDLNQFKKADEFCRLDTTKIYKDFWTDSKLLKIKNNSDQRATVWNLRVKKNQTYFANRCGVHNRKDDGGFIY